MANGGRIRSLPLSPSGKKSAESYHDQLVQITPKSSHNPNQAAADPIQQEIQKLQNQNTKKLEKVKKMNMAEYYKSEPFDFKSKIIMTNQDAHGRLTS